MHSVQFFQSILDDNNVIEDSAILEKYAHDETEDLNFLPSLVLKPENTNQVAAIMQYCNANMLPITVRGGGSGLSGGALPTHHGIVMSMEKMNSILHLDKDNYQVTVEPGMITELLQNTLKESNLFYPVDPSSKGWSFIGGNVSTNAGGPRAVKYGVVKDWVLNLEVVLPSGEIIWTGANTLKNSTGYNLTQLMVGSEGTLGVITKIVLKLIPYPHFNLLMLIPFYHAEEACKAVKSIFDAGITPSALEFMERTAIEWAIQYVGDVSVPLGDNIEAHLLVEVDGNNMETLYQDCEKIAEVMSNYKCDDILFADNDTLKTDFWKLRRNVSNAVKTNSIYKEEDTVVPRSKLPELLKSVKEIGAKYGFQSVCYGHAGDGNLHVNIVKGTLTNDQWDIMLPEAITEIFTVCKSLGGTLSGEHGIGLVQRRYMHIMFPPHHLALMRSIKNVFDPNNILNPGKILPENA
jgi:glycolate oxidase